jgi:hypothetical protein
LGTYASALAAAVEEVFNTDSMGEELLDRISHLLAAMSLFAAIGFWTGARFMARELDTSDTDAALEAFIQRIFREMEEGGSPPL